MTESDALGAWLREQIDADEQIIQAAAVSAGARWDSLVVETPGRETAELFAAHLESPRRCEEHPPGEPNLCDDVRIAAEDDDLLSGLGVVVRHAARFDPARMLAEVEAKRRVLDLHRLTVEREDKPPFDPFTGERTENEFSVECEVCGWASPDPSSGCMTLRMLALPYWTRPGYRPEWAPE